MTANVGAAWAKVYVYPDGIEDILNSLHSDGIQVQNKQA
jgi:hypothetical protein